MSSAAWLRVWQFVEEERNRDFVSPVAPASLAYNLAVCAHREADYRLACLAFDQALRLAHPQEPLRRQAGNALLHVLHEHQVFAPTAEPTDHFLPTSVVVCSHEETRWQHFLNRNHAWLAHCQLVRIADASGIAEAYTRGLAQVQHEQVLLCHDDIQLCAPNALARLSRSLQLYPLLTAVGATAAQGVVWSGAGFEHCHGIVAYPEKAGVQVSTYCLPEHIEATPPALLSCDGCFIAGRAQVLKAVGFSPALAHHFHGYDLDLALRSAQAGHRLGLISDLALLHDSKGNYQSDTWAQAATILRDLHAPCRLPGQQVVANGMVLPDLAAYVQLSQQLHRLGEQRHAQQGHLGLRN
ncbi:MAG: hypothetical protein RLZZ502_993 [Pseudomonadota bacterium]